MIATSLSRGRGVVRMLSYDSYATDDSDNAVYLVCMLPQSRFICPLVILHLVCLIIRTYCIAKSRLMWQGNCIVLIAEPTPHIIPHTITYITTYRP